ncbi:hypothetical protein CFH99_15815 [Nocardioides aromaticivorans]|uniref:DUF2510 domain-containing protein n=1 Tax=Nocardioides aromaticivorans TaxID=200618 RepID=A0ABX7PMB1_9ACTN|nr:DUF2510 domain-containing protein [Nocardioides aromaticivorans]QSR27093.1 hypothetical protein CFH99_15815 [Nocardioides aromaticivorans]
MTNAVRDAVDMFLTAIAALMIIIGAAGLLSGGQPALGAVLLVVGIAIGFWAWRRTIATKAAALEAKGSTAPTAPGWYPYPPMIGTQRYWDGAEWLGEPAPLGPQGGGIDTWKGIRIVAVGILAAAATIYVVYRWSQPSDLDCSLQRLEYANGERSLYDVDDACR